MQTDLGSLLGPDVRWGHLWSHVPTTQQPRPALSPLLQGATAGGPTRAGGLGWEHGGHSSILSAEPGLFLKQGNELSLLFKPQVKNLPANAGDAKRSGFHPWVERSLGIGNGFPW